MMTEDEMRCWRDKEKEKLDSLVSPIAIRDTKNTINILNGLLGDVVKTEKSEQWVDSRYEVLYDVKKDERMLIKSYRFLKDHYGFFLGVIVTSIMMHFILK